MKQILSLCLLLSCLWSNAQIFPPDDEINFPSSSSFLSKNKTNNNKAFGDTLWSEDFAGGLPIGWSIVNNNSNNLQWQWDTVYRSGQFTMNVPAINSTTVTNGFMLVAIDFYNTPITSLTNVDSYFQSGAIVINPSQSVELKLQQFSNFCCSTSGKS
jgi:hypothetical protein